MAEEAVRFSFGAIALDLLSLQFRLGIFATRCCLLSFLCVESTVCCMLRRVQLLTEGSRSEVENEWARMYVTRRLAAWASMSNSHNVGYVHSLGTVSRRLQAGMCDCHRLLDPCLVKSFEKADINVNEALPPIDLASPSETDCQFANA